MNILFADKFQEAYLEELKAQGHTCNLQPDLSADDLPGQVAGAEVLIVRSTKISRATIEAADALKLIVRAGAGVNTIDTEAAAEKNIPVCNVPGKNSVAVAELAFGLLLAIDRNIPDNVIALRSGEWNKKTFSKADGVMGRHIGIVGMGGIGVALAQRAHAFGMQVHFVEPKLSDEAKQAVQPLGAQQHESAMDLARSCDVLSFHVPATDQTKGLIGDQLLAACQPGTIILNTARGELVDDDALIRAMDEKGIRAGLDVYNGEPGGGQGEFDSHLAKHPNVYGTHHIGASTEQAQNAIAAEVVHMLDEFGKGNVLHCVNL